MTDGSQEADADTKPPDDRAVSALVQLRAWFSSQNAAPGTRLPAERELGEILGVSRGDLRKALAILEAEGYIWRHVGKGTFVGSQKLEVANLSEIERETNPAEVMRTRLILEPLIAREAALHATSLHIEALRNTIARSESAASWRQYESADNELHRQIAEAAGNRLLLALFDGLNSVRRVVVWGRLRSETMRPPKDHHSFMQHRLIVEAIAERDREKAERSMHEHLRDVARILLDP